VLLLHGFPVSNYLWRGIIPHLVKAGYRVIAPDQCSFGESEAPEGKENYDMELIARDAWRCSTPLTFQRPRWWPMTGEP
jgi:pimeloyl-ACP methyl ester carboxylesterase